MLGDAQLLGPLVRMEGGAADAAAPTPELGGPMGREVRGGGTGVAPVRSGKGVVGGRMDGSGVAALISSYQLPAPVGVVNKEGLAAAGA